MFVKPGNLLVERIQELTAIHFEESDCFLVEVLVGKNDKIQVFIESDDQLTIDKCVGLSRLLEEKLEAEGLVKEKYLLEVSSPGIDRPLRLLRQFHKHNGRKIEILLNNGIKKEGILVSADETAVCIDEETKSKKKKKEVKRISVPFDSIRETKQKLSF